MSARPRNVTTTVNMGEIDAELNKPLLQHQQQQQQQQQQQLQQPPSSAMMMVKSVRDNHNRCCDNKFWCIRDCCGLVCVFFTWGLIFYAEFVVVRVILMPEFGSIYSLFHFCLFQLLTVMAVASHVRTMLTDPGAVPRGNATKVSFSTTAFLYYSGLRLLWPPRDRS